ncbi:MAG: CHRD domain-containing protein, partial [Acidimicrobiia bacterium]|nr:CHRD domain-containing protein [Acidimicrobiia bacterium]
AVANLPDGSTIETSATFTVSNAAEAADFTLAVSSDPFRTGAVPLNGAVVHGPVYAFVDPLFPAGYEGFRSVDFFLDGTLLHTEYAAPYDAISGGTEKANEALDTTALADGTHEMTVRANRDGGPPLSATATFTVANNVGDIVDVAAADGRFTTLVTAVQAAGLEETLRGIGPFTVLAPTDEAFGALPAGTVEGLLENPTALADILKYHVLAGSVDSATIAGLTAATTLQGSDVTIEVVDGEVILNGTATVIVTDVPASNGIIHAIDMVLMPPAAPPVRFATFNASLNRSNAGDLIADLSTPDNEQAQAVAEIVQRTRPDVLLINEFDYDESGEAARLFQENYLSVSQNGADPIVYDYAFSAPSNTGIPSGLDLDNSGDVGGPNDAFGFGFFPGQFGMQVYSQYPIDFPNVRTFQNFLWADMPGALLPFDPVAFAPWYSEEELAAVRLSSKSHWDVPILVGDGTVNFLVSHPTPPVFDGPEDRNGTRNYDEIRFWKDYVNGADYIYDDTGMAGGWSGDYFVIAGDQNSDPFDGDSQPGAAQLLLDDARVNTSMTPSSLGAVEQDGLQGGINLTHVSDPAFDTADFNDDPAPGNLRADYVLPSVNLDIVDSAVFWPEPTDPLFDLVGTFPFPSSDHRLVWVDVRPGSTELPPPPEPEMLMTYTVTVENLTGGQPFTPLGVTVHDPAFDIFEVGEPANAGIQALAENGDLTGVSASIQANRSLQSGGYAGSAPIVPAADPGGTGFAGSDTFTITALPGHVISLGFMLICTNDGFSGLDSVALPAEGETLVIETNAYDAGTELNTEDFADMVPPCQGLIGVTSDDDGTGATNPELAEGGVIAPHPGITGGTDLDPAIHGWTDPVARITITKGAPAEPSIFEIASGDPQFSTLTTALEMAGLDMVLDEDGPFTVFAPTNDAFDGLPPGLLDELLGDPGFLEAALLFHVTEGALSVAELAELSEVATLLGPPLSIEVTDDGLLIDGVALVVASDIQASNGVIHVIDFVLLPPPPPEPLAFLVAEWQRGTAEVPAIEGSSSLSIAFVDVFEHDPDTLEFCFFVNTSIANPVAAHIHRGAAGENGDVVVNTGFDADSFQVDDLVPTDKFAEGCVDVARTLGEEIIATPGDFYFNVHSVEYPGGENREQLFDASMLAGPPIDFTVAPWRGDLVIPGPGDPGANGRISFTIPQTDTGEWCFNSFISQVEQLDGGYIGAGAMGEASTVLVDLQIGSRWPVVLDPNGQQWIVNGCERVPADLQAQITAAPADFHVQVRTPEFPDGAARAIFGLGAGDENVYLAELFPVDPAVEGGGFTPVVLFPMQNYLCWGVEANGIGEPTAVSINDATGPLMNFDLDLSPFLGGPFAEFTSLGCQAAPAGLAGDILAAPGSFEVVVSNADGPALAGPIFNPEAPPIGEVPEPRDPDSIPLPNGFQPEGVAIGNGTDLFTGSLVSGVIYKADIATKEGAPLVIPTDGRSAIGMTVDTRTNYLYVAGGPFGTAFVYDGDTGEEVAFLQLNDAAPFETLINDVTVTENAAYFTDTFRPVFYEVPLGAGGALPDPIVVNEIPLGAPFPFTPGTINSNGIVAAGDMLIMNHTDEGRLFIVDPATGAATEIDLGGATVPFGDGLVLDGTTLYVVQNNLNQIGVVELSADYSTGTLAGTITSPLFRVPTTAGQSNGDLYAVNARFDVAPPPFPGTPPADPGLDYDVVRVSKDSVTPVANIVASVVRAPIVPDGDVAGAVTDFVINLDRSLDPAVNGRSLATGNKIRITLPDDFIDNGFDTGAPGSATCMPGPCNLGVLLQGWPQHPIAPPAAKYSLSREGTHTFVYTALEDLGPAGPGEPGIKQMHLILLGFTNPAAGDYEILVEAQTGPGGAWESGTGTLTIRPAIIPSINVTSVFNDGTPNTIYQTTPAGQAAPLAHDFLLFDASGGPMTGVTLDGGVLMRDGARVGEVTITAPDGATGQSVSVASPSAEIVGPVLGAATARLTATFTAGSLPGPYSVTYSLDGGTSARMFVTATEAPAAAELEATLDGASEVPGPGDPDGTGTAMVTIEGTTVNWQFTVAGIDMPAAAHIHVGPAGVSGGVEVDLLTTGTLTDNGDGTFTAMGTVEADPEVAAAIVANPAGYYVNVHNAAFGAGAVRGQLSLVTG